MKKADYKFHRDRRGQIENQSRQSDEPFFYFKQAANSPIFIPKRKKKR
jgi:hypothetical protein